MLLPICIRSTLLAKPPKGLHGIVRRQEEEQRTQKQTIDDAFGDLDSLMASAKKMVDLAGTLSEKLATDASADEVSQFRSAMMKLGVSISTGSGSLGSNDQSLSNALSTEITVFLDHIIAKGISPGLISVANLYCMFNRARASTGMNYLIYYEKIFLY